MFHKLPPEIEDMDSVWFRDILLFRKTEDIVYKIKNPTKK